MQGLGELLRSGYVALAAYENRLHEWVTPGDHVADDPEIWLETDLLLAEAFGELDPQSGELLAHRRIDVRIAAGDAITGGTRNRRDAAHEGAPNTAEVEMLGHRWGAPILLADLRVNGTPESLEQAPD